MKKLLFLGFSLFCLSNLNAMDKITEKDYQTLKTSYARLTGPMSSMFSHSLIGFIGNNFYRDELLGILYKYDIEVPRDHNGWVHMFNKMQENIENRGIVKRFLNKIKNIFFTS
jgi:hypothetical protein